MKGHLHPLPISLKNKRSSATINDRPDIYPHARMISFLVWPGKLPNHQCVTLRGVTFILGTNAPHPDDMSWD